MKMMKIALKTIAFIIGGCVAAIVFYFGFHLITDPKLTISTYTMKADIDNPIRIVQLTDLHNAEFGSDNNNLVQTVLDQNPDIIVMTGDMINADEESTSVIEKLVDSLREIAPVYYGYGNHETEWDSTIGMQKGTTIKQLLTAHGITVLEKEFLDIDVDGNAIRIAGYSSYYRNPVMDTSDKNVWLVDKLFFDEFESSSDYKILLNHIPTSWLDWHGINWEYNNGMNEEDYYNCGYAISGFDVDLVFSGHYHGGQWNLPIIGGVYDPGIGFNPPYSKGMYIGSKATCILSSGLGNEYTYIPRINNPPEIVVADIVPE